MRRFLSIVCLSACSFFCAHSCLGIQKEVSGVVLSYGIEFDGAYVYKAELAEVPEGEQSKFTGSLSVSELGGATVVAIDRETFAGFADLLSVSFPNVTRIGANAFSNCADLRSVHFPKLQSVGAGAFDGCGALPSFSFPTGLSAIGANAFSNCGSLESVFIPAGVSSVGDEAFSNCASLKQIVLPLTDSASWGKDVFAGCPNVENVKGWRPGLGISSSKIADVTFADGIREISDGAFKDCPLPSVGIPDSVAKIGANAFSGCSKLGWASFGENVQEVGDGAFQNCSSLFLISRFDAVKSIGLDVFKGCSRLFSPVFSEGIIRWYTETLDDGTLRITGVERVQPEVDDHYLLGPVVIPETIDGKRVTDLWFGDFWYSSQVTTLTIPSGVRSIGKKSFEGCSSLLAVAFLSPSSVTNIEDRAFAGCSDLREIEFPARLKTLGDSSFTGCSSLSNVVMNAGLERIGAEAFRFCVSLGKAGFTIPETVTEIGKDAFSDTDFDKNYRPSDRLFEKDGCVLGWHGTGSNPPQHLAMKTQRMIANGAFEGMTSLESVLFEDSVRLIGQDAFAGCSALSAVNLPATVETVGDGAFANCSSLESLTVASPGTAFGEGVFEGASIKTVTGWRSDLGVNGENLETVVFADGVTEIPAGAFEGGSLESVTIPEGVTAIGARAFANSEKLKTVVLPESLKTIGEEAFAGCTSLEQINVPSNVESIGRDAFEGSPAGEGTLIGWTPERGAIGEGVTTVVIADGVTEIPDNAFAGSNIKSVSIPSSVKRIGYRAFAGCHGLTTVVIPEGVEEIVMAAFSWCDGLREVALPHSLKKTGEYAFEHCPNLKFVQITDQQGQLDVSSSRTYDGCLVDESGVVALVSVKVGKGTKSRGVLKSAVSVSVTGLDGKKKTSKSVKVEVTSAGSLVVPDLVVRDWGTVTGLKIGADGLVGHLADCDIVSADVGGALAAQNPMVVVEFSEGFGGIAGAIQTDLLPSEDEPEAFEITKAGKWAFKKAAGVKWTKPRGESEKRLVVDMDRGKTNLSAMKLTYTPKTGLFKGSFKLYSLTGTGEKTKLKKTTVTVSGFVIGGKAQGIAFVKGLPQNWGVEVR